jgi:opacity protein-like surface antigen
MRQIISFTQCLLWRITFLSVGAIICSTTAVFAQAKPNSIGPTVTFGNGSSTFGVGGKFRLIENVFEVKNTVSLRPFVRFPSEGVDVGAGVTYDFDFPRYSQVTPYAGIGLGALNGTVTSTNFLGTTTGTQKVNEVTFYGQAGVEINASQDLSLSGNLQVPFNNKFGTNFTFGANYRF